MTRMLILLLLGAFQAVAAEPKLHSFQRQTLSTEYYCEGAGFGDVSLDGKPEGKKELKLFNLAKDIHEDTDVASTNPKVVKQLLAYAEAARKDLGDTNRPGKGQRKAGWVDKASPRLLAK